MLLALGLFAYMTFHIGVLRFDRALYNRYIVTFKDVSGLSRKADVKIAGVKVGWIDSVVLFCTDSEQCPESAAEVTIMVLKDYIIHSDAYALVRQEGFLGNKYIELIPGDPYLPVIPSGGRLLRKSLEPISVDDILRQVKHIASNVDDITSSLKEVLGGPQGTQQVRTTLDNFNSAVNSVSSLAGSIERIVRHNEQNVNFILSDLRDVSKELKYNVQRIGDDVHQLAHDLETNVFPAFQTSVQTIAQTVDRDFSRITTKLEGTSVSLDEAALQVRDGFKNVSEVAQKLNEGRGVLGKLINEDETYRDIKIAVSGLKNYLAKVDTLGIVVDAHSESMHRPICPYTFQNAKGYFNLRIHPNEDHFYLIGIVGSTLGYIEREVKFRRWFTAQGCPLIPDDLNLRDRDILRFAPRKDTIEQKLDRFTINAQFGKIFKDIAVRFGIFENTAGIAVDYDIPFDCERLRWVMSLEAFDLRGRMRLADDRPHLKWINNVFVTRNIYLTFGADDFISRRSKNAFFGFGIRFADDDLKYLLSKANLTW